MPFRRLGRRLRALGRGGAEAASSAPAGFELRPPSVQNAVDIFKGGWASDIGAVLPGVESGRHGLFTDPRPRIAAEQFGAGGRIDGFSVLELGPLEGAHSYQLEHLGAAEVVAIEANVSAFLKCLIVKEALQLQRARFLLGDFSEFLRTGARRFDMVFASGVLYHLEDPLDLIALICAATDRCFVWTHYYDAVRCPGRTAQPVCVSQFETTYYRKLYDAKGAQFWGGNRDTASWMPREAILDAFRHFGLTEVTVIEDDPGHVNGPAFTFTARRPG